MKISIPIVCGLAALMLSACFTGVESTPRIDSSVVKRQHASKATPEQELLKNYAPQPPSKWQHGHRFRVVDNRISLIFTSASSPASSLVGKDLIFTSASPAVSVTGTDATELRFRTDDGGSFYYNVPTELNALDTLERLDIPFTVDMDLVGRLDNALRGMKLFIRTPAWYEADGERKATGGLRHIEVEVDSVGPGNTSFPAAVYFHILDPAMAALAFPSGNPTERMVYMSVGKGATATRNFDTLFSFDNPRKSYPGIEKEVWELIIRSKVRIGMSREECRLAIGAPTSVLRTPTYGGMRESWSYTDGVFLIFDDGYLSRFRL